MYLHDLKLGNVILKNNILLAPMAGITDLPFRLICEKFEPGLVTTEMVSSKAILYNDEKTKKLMNMQGEKRPVAIQIFGSDTESMAYAAKYVSEIADIVDINMGCPAPKVTKNGDGSKLLTDLDKAFEVVSSVVKSSSKPVTVKMRTGWDKNSIVAVEAAKMLENAGIDGLTVHGRTRTDYYSGKADLEVIKKVKEAVDIPVIGNGDIVDEESAKKMFEYTGVDGIMIGRGAFGNPYIFEKIKHYLQYGEKLPDLDNSYKLDLINEHLNLLIEEKGEYTGIREFRKHLAYYTKGIPNSSEFRSKINTLESKEEVEKEITCFWGRRKKTGYAKNLEKIYNLFFSSVPKNRLRGSNMYRTKNLGELRIENVGEIVELAGWVQKVRNLGGMVFIDLRDEMGITQIVVNDEKLQEQAKELNTESCIHISGQVVERTSKNPKMKTGDIEVFAEKIEVLGKCKNVLPFEINTDQDVREDLRLEYRFLDLRNEKLHNNILLRSKILKTLRDRMDELGFAEIQTPILANSSPEGARDYLVPSRLHPGEFYALPQAPQQFKQLLMVSGFNRYFQIAPCFRDEDPRADRAPGEFYQLDFEMSFATQEDVFKVIEQVVPHTFKKFTDWKVDEGDFVRIPYREAMEKYGIDKPDLRNPLIIQDVTKLFEDTEFNAFKDKTVKVIIVSNGAEQGRKFFDKMSEFAMTDEVGAKGLAWTKINVEGEVEGGIAKFITDTVKERLISDFGAEKNCAMFFVADEFNKAQKISGLVRIELGKRLDLIESNVYKFCFIVDFPMYELSDEGTIDFCHNPFSMPQGGLDALNTMEPLDILAYQFDLVCNGYEMASGAVRNHDPEIMIKAFEIAGYEEEDIKKRFGALYNAFQYGTPPHAGAAPGVDRMVMLIADSQNIREIIAFPKNKRARDVLMGAPSKVDVKQLDDVHISVKE